jgi:hypothetical protein
VHGEVQRAAIDRGSPLGVCAQEAFGHRVRHNLHIILCMSPVGGRLRTRCRQFPSLINCCTIDWFNPWPPAALVVR